MIIKKRSENQQLTSHNLARCYHILGDLLTKPNAHIEALRNNIPEAIVVYNFDGDLGELHQGFRQGWNEISLEGCSMDVIRKFCRTISKLSQRCQSRVDHALRRRSQTL